MKKIVNPSICNVYNGTAPAFAEIKYEYGKLSICGVVGPMRNGNCKGSAGQCVDEIGEGEPTEEWNAEMLAKFCEIWNKWHLNDLTPDCEHQRADAEFQKAKSKKVKVYEFLHLNDDLRKEKSEISKFVDISLRENGTVTLTDRQKELYCMKYCIYEHIGEYDTSIYHHNEKDVEYKTLNWISHDKYEEGLMSKPCPICGYKYGSKWLKKEVPDEVVQFLESLPESKVKPAWV